MVNDLLIVNNQAHIINKMSNYKKLQAVLREIFEIDKADLDFGIYRIMNQKRDDINKFIDTQLPKDIKDILSKTQSLDGVQLQKELEDLSAMEQEIFSHLSGFFKRYYNEGDFISQRRYKKDVYAIPYEGEEVKLHWANADQYYIKTSEYLKDYAFVLPGNKKKVVFQLKEASTEQNNNKTQGDGERRFAIYEEEPIGVDGNTLTVNFTYELHKKSVNQDDLTSQAFHIIKKNRPDDFGGLFEAYRNIEGKTKTRKENKKDVVCEVIYHHLNSFISRNTFDYFIHKDLGAFLRRELDFYIKNEILFIDDINTENPAFFTAQLSKIKAFKTVADKIITFLAQIEDFQKKLWLKKKFVIRTDYCITIDRIPEKYHQEIVGNKDQIEEWKELFDVQINTVEDLVFEQFLVLDTKHFSEEFKDKLIAEFYNLDEETNGLLINSENFQALNLINCKFKSKVNSVYIDPPFNLDDSKDFLYSVNYKDSTWLSMLYDRVFLSKSMLTNGFNYFIRCDVNGNYLIRNLGSIIFKQFNNELVLKNANQQGAIDYRFNPATESLFFYRDSENYFNPIYKKREVETKWINMHSPKENTHSHLVRIHDKEYIAPKGRHWTFSQKRVNDLISLNRIRILEHIEYNDVYGNEANGMPQYLTSDEEVIDSNWTDIPGYSSTSGFSTENSEHLLGRVLECSTNQHQYILDFFLGSGTTAAVALKMNRKFIGVEMGKYFEKYPLTRIKKVLGRIKTGTASNGLYKENIVKYQVLESYEDTLNNLFLAQKDLGELGFDEDAQEEYLLQYMLDVESRDHLFNVEIFRNPFDYKLKVTENNELIPTKVDLVETFNYLIGLYVEHIQRRKDIKFVEGTTREGVKTLVIWRNLETTTNKETEEVFRRLFESERTSEFNQIYINGDHNLTNFRTGEDQFKVKMIEETFFNKMFDVNYEL